MNVNERINQIEMLLAHQTKQIDELSDMTTAQWHEIDRLKRKLDITQQKLNEIEISGKDPKSEIGLSATEVAALNKPPHY